MSFSLSESVSAFSEPVDGEDVISSACGGVSPGAISGAVDASPVRGDNRGVELPISACWSSELCGKSFGFDILKVVRQAVLVSRRNSECGWKSDLQRTWTAGWYL